MNPKLTITYDDGRVVESTGKPADYIRFERQFGQPISSLSDEKDFRMEWAWYLGWLAARRAEDDTPGFDDWIDTVEAVDVDFGGDPPLDQSP